MGLVLAAGVIPAAAVYVVYEQRPWLSLLTGVFGVTVVLMTVATRRRFKFKLESRQRRRIILVGAALLGLLELSAAVLALVGGNGTTAAILSTIAGVTLLSGAVLRRVLPR